jgi:hypothetical protein
MCTTQERAGADNEIREGGGGVACGTDERNVAQATVITL